LLFVAVGIGGVEGVCAEESGADAGYFLLVEAGEAAEDAASFGGERDADDTAVLRVLRTAYESRLLGALDEADDGVVAFLEEFGELGDGGVAVRGEACDAEHELVLLGRDARLAGGIFAEVEELAEGVAEGGEVAEGFGEGFVRVGNGLGVGHGRIISYYDINNLLQRCRVVRAKKKGAGVSRRRGGYCIVEAFLQEEG
jgi:hypothetical protein